MTPPDTAPTNNVNGIPQPTVIERSQSMKRGGIPNRETTISAAELQYGAT